MKVPANLLMNTGCWNAATTAINMFDGMSAGRDLDEIVQTWDCGFLELTQELSLYALLSEKLLVNLPDWDFPGVYDYEVSRSFGDWFGRFIVVFGRAPSWVEGVAQLEVLATVFFRDHKGRES